MLGYSIVKTSELNELKRIKEDYIKLNSRLLSEQWDGTLN